jgi:hypothetical protein
VWNYGSSVLISYANAYALGAFLARNFGGAELIQKMMAPDGLVDTASITAALNSDTNPLKNTINTFSAALSRYGEVLLFNQTQNNRPADVLSFNNTVTKTIGSTNYTFHGFDVWKIGKPAVWKTDTVYSLKPRTMILETKSNWQNISGSLSITVKPPENSAIDFYIIVR